MNTIKTDILIVGAGYAGIAAAKKLSESGKNFVVIEARDRIGGRTLTEKQESGVTVELGAKWIGPTQQRVWEWVNETKASTYSTYDSGKNLLIYNGKKSSYSGAIPKIDPISLIDLGLAINKINKLSAQISLENPWKHPKAKAFDAMTLATWMDKNIRTPKAKLLFEIGIQTVFAAEAAELSFLYALFYFRSGDNMDTLISIKNGAQQTILQEGTQGLVKKIAAPFEKQIYLNTALRKITQTNETVLAFADNLMIEAKRCILAIPPVMLNQILFSPVLPQQKAQLYQRVPMGAAMKVYLIYPTPFWRKKGLSGQIVSNEFPVKITFDVGHDDNDKGILLVFVEGNDARNFIDMPQAIRKQLIIEKVIRFLGEEASNPIEYIDKCWTEEEWTRGCYVGLMGPNTLTQFGPILRKPFGLIHFAGTETAQKWNGYLDGAIESGYRAADEVSKGL